MSLLKNKLNEINSELDGIEKMIFSDSVYWDDVVDWEVGETRDIGGSTNTKIIGMKNLMVFQTRIPTKFPPHKHPKFWEFNLVINGTYRDEGIEKHVGELVTYPPNKKHIVESGDDTTPLDIVVIFYKE